MKKLIIVIIIVLFLMSGCTITITFGGFGNDANFDLTDQELSSEITGFDGRLAIENILTYESWISKTGFYIDGNLEHKNNDLGNLQDSLIIGDTLYLAFDSKGVISLALNNPDFDKIDEISKDNKVIQAMKLVSDGTNVYFVGNSELCRIDKDHKETCVDYYKEGSDIDVLELYKGNLYVSILDSTGDDVETILVTIDPKTLKVSSTSNLDFNVVNSAVVGNTLYIDTGNVFGVYENGKINHYNINNYVYESNTSSDENEYKDEDDYKDEADYEDDLNGLAEMKSVGDKLLVETNDGKVLSIDPKQNHKVTELVNSGEIMSVNGDEAYISDLSWDGEKNILKYDSKTNKTEYIDYIEDLSSDMYLFY